jgi:titin
MSFPYPPTNVVAVPGNKIATISWTPGSNNGAIIYGYKVTSNRLINLPTGYVEVLGPTTTTAIVYGLSNDTIYTFKVNAINKNGYSQDSTYSNEIVPYTIPDPPTNVIADPSNGFAKITWTVPNYNGGSTIYGYTATSIPEGRNASIIGFDSSSVIVTGLTNGTSYNFAVVATNAAGSSLPTNTIISVIPKTIPLPPTNLIATPGNRQIVLEWSSPINTGGTPIINYIIYTYLSTDNTQAKTPITTTNSNTTYLISDLSINTGYYFKAVSINIIGRSVDSSVSNTINTYNVPDPPTNIIAYPGVNSARITWTAPTNVVATGYNVYIYPVTNASQILGSVGNDVSLNIINLEKNTSYKFVVIAKNDSGLSIPSNESNLITTNNIPAAPINVIADASNQSALLNWTNGYDGGSSITSYIINAIPYTGIPIVSRNVTTNPGYISNLLIDTSYSFTVTAINAVGISDVSGITQGYIRTYGYPDPPIDLSYDASFGNVTIHWQSPANTGRTRITGYDIISSDRSMTYSTNEQTIPVIISPPTQINIDNLINGQTYTFNLYARNIVGQSKTYSSINVKPARYPDPPRDVSANTGNQSATIYWVDPSDGGSQITSYNIKIRDISSNSITISKVYSKPGQVTGLLVDTSYVFAVNAINNFGDSSYSSFSIPIRTFNYPGKPTNIVGFSGTRSIRVFWSKPITNGRTPITGYIINLYDSNLNPLNQLLINNVTDLSYTIPNLLNNTGYIITMNSKNIVGISEDSIQTQPIITFNIPNKVNQISGTPGDFKVFLNWTAPYNGGTSIIRYDISVNYLNPDINLGITNFDTSVNALNNKVEPITSITVLNLLRDTSYNFTITTVNEVGQSLKSNVITVRTNNVPEPPIITNVTAGNSEITIDWDLPNNGGSSITNYIIHSYRKEQGSGLFLYNSTTKITNNITFTTITGLINGDLYKFRIVAVNGVGESLMSDYSEEISPIYVAPLQKDEPSEYCKKTCHPIYKKMATSTNNPNVSKRMLYSKTVNNKCSVKNNVTYNQLVEKYNFPPLDVSGINQRQIIAYKSPAFLNAMF